MENRTTCGKSLSMKARKTAKNYIKPICLEGSRKLCTDHTDIDFRKSVAQIFHGHGLRY